MNKIFLFVLVVGITNVHFITVTGKIPEQLQGATPAREKKSSDGDQEIDLRSKELVIFPPDSSGKNNESITRIDLRYNQIQQIAPAIACFRNVQILRLDSNKLTMLPPEIGTLTELRYLDVSCNALEYLPAEIGFLKKLSYLNLLDNKLKTLPPEIGNLPEGASIEYITSNPIESLPPTLSKSKLDCLFLSDDELQLFQRTYLKNITSFIVSAIKNGDSKKVRKFTRSILVRCELDPNTFINSQGDNLIHLALQHTQKDPEHKIILELIACGIHIAYTDLITILGLYPALFTQIYKGSFSDSSV